TASASTWPSRLATCLHGDKLTKANGKRCNLEYCADERKAIPDERGAHDQARPADQYCKDTPEYKAITTTITMNPEDMKEAGIIPGSKVRVVSDNGEALFQCKEGKVPPGMIFVPYGPPTCKLMGQTTDGTGMPTSKGWEVEVQPVSEG